MRRDDCKAIIDLVFITLSVTFESKSVIEQKYKTETKFSHVRNW